MYIDLDDAIKIYAKACRAWYGRRARNVVLRRAGKLQELGDTEGARVWHRVEAELARSEAIGQPDQGRSCNHRPTVRVAS